MLKEALVKKISCLIMAMLLAVSGFLFVSCGSDGDGDGGGTPTVVVTLKNVRITGTAKVGNTLTAVASTTDGKSGTEVSGVTYQWYYADSEDTADDNLTAIDGATAREFEVTPAYVDKYIKVSATKGSATEYSEFKGPVTITSVKTVAVTGTAKVGETLTATVTDTDGTDITTNENVSYQWYSSTSVSSGFTAISGANASSYELQSTDANKYVKVSATLNNNIVYSDPTDAVYIATIAEVKANGDAKVGATLTAVATDTDGSTDGTGVTFEWFVSDTNSIPENAVSIATESSYTIPAAYYDKYLIVKATKNGGYATYPTTKVQAGALVDTGYTLTYDNAAIDTYTLVLPAALDNTKLAVTGLKDGTSQLDVTGGTAEFRETVLTVSKPVTIEIKAAGYDTITKDVFITVQAAVPTTIPSLISDATVLATVSAGFVKFNIDTDSDYSSLERSADDGATWLAISTDQFKVTSSDEKLLIRVKKIGDIGTTGYVKESENIEIQVVEANKGTKPAAHVEVTLKDQDMKIESAVNESSGDVTITATAPKGFDDYSWLRNGETFTGVTGLSISDDGKTLTVDVSEYGNTTAAIVDTFTVTASKGSDRRSATVSVTVPRKN